MVQGVFPRYFEKSFSEKKTGDWWKNTLYVCATPERLTTIEVALEVLWNCHMNILLYHL